ncbi:MAG: hypothetical protein K2X77_17205 [Candidatus Obscuribacterales bacterium]|nr:hypothetical protein [Candidatus Obscuribacterales bacterium]
MSELIRAFKQLNWWRTVCHHRAGLGFSLASDCNRSALKRLGVGTADACHSVEHKRLCEAMGGRDVRAPYERERS